MIKIINDYDLAGLTKYGFDLVNYYDQSESYVLREGNRVIMRVVTHTRQVKISSSRSVPGILFDMFTDGIVEKVK